jgi:glyoxylase-like metal-dependent hydrolase (beta-lactamase superfamily II)
VFLTSFRPAHRRGLGLFEQAVWHMFENEIRAVSQHLHALLRQEKEGGVSPDPLIHEELALLDRTKAAPDRLAPAVDLFPTPGVTPGACGLLALFPNMTLAVAGDAVISKDYFQKARIYEHCVDAEAAKQSFADIVEIADALVPGHDNIIYR